MKKLGCFSRRRIAGSRQEIGASSLPDGEAFYQYSIRRQTTTDLTAKQIHEVGLKEVARIRREMEDVIGKTGFKGSFAEFLTFLRTDPRFYYTKADDLVAGYSHIAKVADGELPKLFAELPRTPYGVRVIPDYEGPRRRRLTISRARRTVAGGYNDQHLQARHRAEVRDGSVDAPRSGAGHHLRLPALRN